jgi:polysaccharide deacetylase family sporulation protein PdaB
MITYYFSISRLKKNLLAGSLLCLVVLLLTAVLLKPAGIVPAQGKPHAVYKVKTNKKVAALTFNISWGGRVPGPVLDALKKSNARATFFVSGAWVKKYPELARRITAEGHEIQSNGDRQINLSSETRSTVKNELARSRDYIKEVTGVSPTLLRMPYGDWNDMVLAAAAESGYTVVQWSVDSLDLQTPGKNNIVNNVVKKIHPGAIVLMYACDTASQTPEALPAVIEGLRADGYELVTVSSLLKQGPGVVD